MAVAPVDVDYSAWDAVDICSVDFTLSEGTEKGLVGNAVAQRIP